MGDFNVLVNIYSMIAWGFYLAVVLGLVVLRITEVYEKLIIQPYAKRPFKVYIFVPVIFICIAISLLTFSISEAPFEAALASMFLISGVPMYIARTRYAMEWEEVGHVVFGKMKGIFSRITSTRTFGRGERRPIQDENIEMVNVQG